MPSDLTLIRCAGAAALAGALLRALAAWPALPLSDTGMQALYLVIDFLLTLGLVGAFVEMDGLRTWLGTLGFLGALGGILLVRTGDQLGGEGGYARATSVLALALGMVGLVLLIRERGFARLAGLAWIASLGTGLAGSFGEVSWGFLAASLLFCLGFALAGVSLIRTERETQGWLAAGA